MRIDTARTARQLGSALLLFAVLGVTGVADAAAQVRRGRTAPPVARWAPVSAGLRFGYDQAAQGEVVGLQIRIPIVRSGVIELAPNAERIFLTGARETQYNLQLDYVPAGPRGGVVLGAGIGWRNTIVGVPLGQPAATYFGYTVMLGGKTNLGPVQLELGLRWAFLNDTQYQPNSATLGLNVPFWRVGPTPG